jgi:hypothetical protein
MAIEVLKVDRQSQNQAIVTIAGTTREEVDSTRARTLAIEAATQYLGSRCGFSSYLDWTYQNPPDAQHPQGQVLDEAALATPGAMKPGGRFLRLIRINAA